MRLSNIVVDEVSLVDKAANKRKFAICKREAEVKDEVIEAEKILKGEDPSPEEQAQLETLLTEFNELTALLKS